MTISLASYLLYKHTFTNVEAYIFQIIFALFAPVPFLFETNSAVQLKHHTLPEE